MALGVDAIADGMRLEAGVRREDAGRPGSPVGTHTEGECKEGGAGGALRSVGRAQECIQDALEEQIAAAARLAGDVGDVERVGDSGSDAREEYD